MGEFVYDAFISYSHLDLKWGRWLQRRLETYRLPREAREQRPGQPRLRVFRDQTDLAGVELQRALHKELQASRFLIVICSPGSAASRWVAEEIGYFQSLGRSDHVIPFIVDGEPNSDHAELECYPAPLRSDDGKDLLGANIREIGKNKAFLKLMAILLDVRFNRLVDRDKQRRRRTLLISGTAALVLLLSGGGLLWRNAVISRENEALSYDIYGAAIVSIAQKDVIEPDDVAFLRVSAEAGNLNAILLLADCCQNGWGMEADPEAAFSWFMKAAEAGDPQGMIAISNCYHDGIGTAVDPEQSFIWDLRAAEAKHPAGMLNVGICYENGFGTEADPAAAVDWYRKSAEAGYDLGIYNLARCYMSGMGTDIDPEQAFQWIKQLAENGNAEGMYNLGLMYQFGYGTELTPRLAYLWYRAAANAGDANAMYKVGWCTENRFGTEDAAQEWYLLAASSGSEEAQAALASQQTE